jgi:integrase
VTPSKQQTHRKRRARRGSGSIYQVEGRNEWVGAISLGIDADGKRIRRVVYGKSQKVVQQKIDKLKARTGAELAASTTITFGAFAKDWFTREVEQNRRPTTQRYYKLLLDDYIEPQLGRKRLAEIAPADVERTVAIARERRSAAMAAKVRGAIGRILNRARRLGLISSNAATATEVPRVERRAMKFLEPQQVRRLLDAAEGERLGALVVVLVTAGLRIGEALALTWDDVNLRRGEMRVDKTVMEAKGPLQIAHPKTAAGKRMIVLTQRAIKALRRRLELAKAEGYARKSDPIFPTTTGTYQRRKNFTARVFQPLLTAAKLPAIRVHDLRHSSAALSIAAGANPRTVSERLGHADPSFTLRTYGHAPSELHRKDADAIDRLLRRPRQRRS